ncbi:MAG TPA: Na(+)-translocating NADH-quinone reductase subunit C, partial [Gammaproteobacteria bacterium]|nr:Na(+)-translocating NADH-quinone reductase subunit C [Gammaproteobacteria bacterium]
MSSSNESTQKTVTVALVLCLVCSIIVSAAAVILRPA